VSALVAWGLKIAFLALLWLFVALVAGVIKADVFGRVMPAAGGGTASVKAGPAQYPQFAQTAGQAAGQTTPGGQAVPKGAPNPKRRGPSVNGPQIVVLDGPGKGDAVPLRGEIVVGRDPDATLDITDDYASGQHARFYRDDESWIVADMGSTNGTVVNGLRIARATRVGDGDVVRVGRTSLRVEES